MVRTRITAAADPSSNHPSTIRKIIAGLILFFLDILCRSITMNAKITKIKEIQMLFICNKIKTNSMVKKEVIIPKVET